MDQSPADDQADDRSTTGNPDLEHALRTPLTVAVLRVHLLRRHLQRGEIDEALASELDRIADPLADTIAALAAIEAAERQRRSDQMQHCPSKNPYPTEEVPRC